MVSINGITAPQIAAIFDDAGYVLGVLAASEIIALNHPDAAAYLGIGATISLGLANRINPTNAATPGQIGAAIDAISKS